MSESGSSIGDDVEIVADDADVETARDEELHKTSHPTSHSDNLSSRIQTVKANSIKEKNENKVLKWIHESKDHTVRSANLGVSSDFLWLFAMLSVFVELIMVGCLVHIIMNNAELADQLEHFNRIAVRIIWPLSFDKLLVEFFNANQIFLIFTFAGLLIILFLWKNVWYRFADKPPTSEPLNRNRLIGKRDELSWDVKPEVGTTVERKETQSSETKTVKVEEIRSTAFTKSHQITEGKQESSGFMLQHQFVDSERPFVNVSSIQLRAYQLHAGVMLFADSVEDFRRTVCLKNSNPFAVSYNALVCSGPDHSSVYGTIEPLGSAKVMIQRAKESSEQSLLTFRLIAITRTDSGSSDNLTKIKSLFQGLHAPAEILIPLIVVKGYRTLPPTRKEAEAAQSTIPLPEEKEDEDVPEERQQLPKQLIQLVNLSLIQLSPAVLSFSANAHDLWRTLRITNKHDFTVAYRVILKHALNYQVHSSEYGTVDGNGYALITFKRKCGLPAESRVVIQLLAVPNDVYDDTKEEHLKRVFNDCYPSSYVEFVIPIILRKNFKQSA